METRSQLRKKIWVIVIVASIADLADLTLLKGIEEICSPRGEHSNTA